MDNQGTKQKMTTSTTLVKPPDTTQKGTVITRWRRNSVLKKLPLPRPEILPSTLVGSLARRTRLWDRVCKLSKRARVRRTEASLRRCTFRLTVNAPHLSSILDHPVIPLTETGLYLIPPGADHHLV
jgi:hypothetical protein